MASVHSNLYPTNLVDLSGQAKYGSQTQAFNRSSVQTVDSGYGSIHPGKRSSASTTKTSRQSTLPPGARDSVLSTSSIPPRRSAYSPGLLSATGEEDVPPVPKLDESVIAEKDEPTDEQPSFFLPPPPKRATSTRQKSSTSLKSTSSVPAVPVQRKNLFVPTNPYYEHGAQSPIHGDQAGDLAQHRMQVEPEQSIPVLIAEPIGQESPTAISPPVPIDQVRDHIVPSSFKPFTEPKSEPQQKASFRTVNNASSASLTKIKGVDGWNALHVYRPTDSYSYSRVVKGADKTTTLYYMDYKQKGSKEWASSLRLAGEKGKVLAEMGQDSKGRPINLNVWNEDHTKKEHMELGSDGVLKTHLFNADGQEEYKWKMSGFGNLKCTKQSTGEVVAHYHAVVAVTKYAQIAIEPNHGHLQDLLVTSALARTQQMGGRQVKGPKKTAKRAVDFAWWIRGMAGGTDGTAGATT